jgi:hypothetical protein
VSALAVTALLAGPLTAQERAPGGRLLTFGLSTGLTASDNPDLDADGRGEVTATTGLSIALLSLTPTQRFELGTGLGVAARAGGDPDAESFVLSDPNAALLYSRISRASRLTLSGEFEIDEITAVNPLELATGDLLDLEDEEELEALIEANQVPSEARRLTFDLGTALETRRGTPFGVTYELGITGVRYTDAPAAFEDETRLSAGLGLRFDLTKITQATADLDAVTSLDTAQDDDRLSLELGVAQARPAGNIGVSLGLVDDNGDLRTRLSLNGAIERPTTVLGGSIGVSRAEDGDLALIGSTNLTHQITDIQSLRFGLNRQVTQLDTSNPASPGTDRVITSLQAGYDHDITRLWRLGVDTRYTRAATSGPTDARDTFAEIGASLARPLTEDWAFNIRLSHRFETNSDGPDAQSNTISFSLDRNIRIPY